MTPFDEWCRRAPWSKAGVLRAARARADLVQRVLVSNQSLLFQGSFDRSPESISRTSRA